MRNNLFEDITIIIIAYKSEHIIHKCLKHINEKYNIIIIDNSNNLKFKKLIEKKYNNTKVILANNIGFGPAINLAASKVKTKYFLSISPDVILNNQMLELFYLATKECNNKFLAFCPEITFHDKKKFKGKYQIKIKKNILIKTKIIPGATIFFHTINFKKINGFDKKIFMYYEENDLCKRAIKEKLNLYKILGTKVLHLAAASTNPKIEKEFELNRNWHFMWSQFYFYKKHYGYIFSLIFNFRILTGSILKVLYYSYIDINLIKKKNYKARFDGLINSILLKKAWYRI